MLQTPDASYHVIANPIVQLEGDTARSEVTWVVVGRDAAGKPTVPMIGRHQDELVREDGRWKILRRAGLDMASPAPYRAIVASFKDTMDQAEALLA